MYGQKAAIHAGYAMFGLVQEVTTRETEANEYIAADWISASITRR